MSTDPMPQDIQIFRDNDLSFLVEIKNAEDGELKDLTSWEGWFAVKDRDTFADSQILIIKRTTVLAEGEKVAGSVGVIQFHILRTDTADLKAGIYFWDAGIWADSIKHTVAKGQLELKQPILLGDVPAVV